MTDSIHYEVYGLLLLSVLAMLPLVFPVIAVIRWVRLRRGAKEGVKHLVRGGAIALAIYGVVTVEGFLVEPNWPEVRKIKIPGRLKSELTILHLSDLHIEPVMAPRDRWLIEAVRKVSPDMIVITGDIHQVGNEDFPSLGRVLQEMKAPLGVFACAGYDDLELLREVSPNIVYLQDEGAFVEHEGDVIAVLGSPGRQLKERASKLESVDYRIVLEHTPDRVNQAGELLADLYLCGHTHGGQVRIPFWGAVITNSPSGKRYEAGLYRQGDLFIHTSRGLGLEPKPAPQVRFLCRPEITIIRIVRK